jgi:CO/xanthine dehydrogenase Mo-binding subunit
MFDPKKSTPKVDHEEKCSGQAQYVSDIVLDDMLYAKTVRSTIARGYIRAIGIPTLPRGYHIVDHRDVVKENYVKMIFNDWPVFTVDRVNYIGEPIMLVVGPDKRVIDEIISEIKIDYEEETPVFDYSKSVVHKSFTKGDLKATSKDAVRVIKETFNTGYQEQAYIEPQGMLAYLEEGGKVTLVGSMQCPYYIKNAVINTLGYPEDKVRVIQPAVGGAFGGKEEFPSTTACQLATAVVKIKKPIKMIFEREEDMLVTTKRHPSTTTLEAHIDKNNKVLWIKAHVS